MPVELNQTGPYDFLLDTGSQITVIDPALAATLGLRPQDTANLHGVETGTVVALSRLSRLEIGPNAIEQAQVAVQELAGLKAYDPRIRGVLGGDMLRHFEVLLDPGKMLLCLDRDEAMQPWIEGERLAFVTPDPVAGRSYATEPTIAPVYLAGLKHGPLYFLIDSGANVPYLASGREEDAIADGAKMVQAVSGDREAGQSFRFLPPQDIRIGRSLIRQVAFATPLHAEVTRLQVNGILPAALFRGLYISYSQRFMILSPRTRRE